MKYKCAFYENTDGFAFPTHSYLSGLMEKNGKVLFGGKKSITKTTPFPTKLNVITLAYDTFNIFLQPTIRASKWYEKELYIFEYGADLKVLQNEYPTQFRTCFEIDEELVDKLQSYVYKYEWLNKFATLIDRDIEMLDFIKDNQIGDETLFEKIPNYMMSTEEFLKQVNITAIAQAENACSIFKSGWH